MALSSPDSKSGQASIPKAKEVKFPLAGISEPPKQQFKESDLRTLRAILPHHAERILISALNRTRGDQNAAVDEIITHYPLEYTYAPPLTNIEEGLEIAKSEETSCKHVNGIIPRQTLRLRNGTTEVAIKSEAHTDSLELPPTHPASSSNHPTKTEFTTPFEEHTDVDDDDIDMDETDSDEVDYNADQVYDSVDVKAEELYTIFPGTDLEDCKRMLQCADGDLVEAVDMMEEERGGDLLEDTIMGGTSARVNNTAADLCKLSPSPIACVMDSGKKRVAEDSEDRLIKKIKSREVDKRLGTGLSPAGQWVSEFFEEKGDIRLIFEDGEHPCRFSKKLLTRYFQQLEMFFASEVKLDECHNIDNQSRETFDLLLQWAVARNIQLDTAKHQTKASEITMILKIVKLANDMDMKELAALEDHMAKILTEILKEERTALKGEHIRFAYAHFDIGHSIQDTFIKAAVRTKIEFRTDVRDQGMGRQDIRAHLLPDGARKKAWGGSPFPFAKEMEIEDFELRLLRLSMKTWESREIGKKKLGGRTQVPGFFMTDPLTGERFFF